MASKYPEQAYLIPYGPDANCTLDLCPVTDSVYQYRPSLAANTSLLVLFFLSLLIHLAQGLRYRTYFYAAACTCGCICEILGYGGRLILHQNPFDFNGFLMQICCITFAPVFFCAAIYVTLSRLTNFLDPTLTRFPPSLYYWVFVPCDLVSLVLQAAGGAMSSSSSGSSRTANDITLAGLSFQVITLVVFVGLALDYVVRYWRQRRAMAVEERRPFDARLKVFAAFFAAAIVLILIRCCYRIDELSEGYSGALIHDEGLFIALEGVMVLLATYCLNVGHPGEFESAGLDRGAC